MASIVSFTGSSTAHLTTLLAKSATDVYEDVSVEVSGSTTGSIAFISLTLVKKAYGTPTDVILCGSITVGSAVAGLAGSYSDSSALYRVSHAWATQANGSLGEAVAVALVKKEGTN